ncbi:MAG: hemerythrin domain-containing protein, partial [Aeromicrobium sp.]|nr:hemerythrin domain-containing protein [Burkholderiales bacterium]
MKKPIAFEDAADLLDADHNAVKKMFQEHNAMWEDNAAAVAKHRLAKNICQALTVHAQIEEEIFYPQV